MKLNLEQLKIYRGIARNDKDADVVDVREQFADLIYKGAAGIAALELARKIYMSNEETGYTDDEIAMMQRYAGQCTPQFIDALESLINSNKSKQ